MHGLGGVTRPSISASPVVVAGAMPATRFTILGVLVTGSILWQLRIAAKLAIGLAPVPTRTRPVTWTSSFPVESSSARPEVIFQGAPPPPRLRMGLVLPVKGGTTAVIRLNSNRLNSRSLRSEAD